MANHIASYKRWKDGKCNFTTSGTLFEKYGVENCHIVILESVNANNKDELCARERYWIQSLRCVNKNISGRNNKEWREANRDIIRIQKNTYAKEHSEAIRIRKKQYYLDNKEHIKQYYLDNKEHILERCKQYQLEKRNTQS